MPARNPTTDEFRALVKKQVNVLQGKDVDAAGLGPLAGYHIADAQWKPHGINDVRLALQAALEHWATTSDVGKFQNGRTPDTARRALEALWGVSMPPVTLKTAAEIVSVKSASVAEWQRRVTASPMVRAWLAGQALVIDDLELPSTSRPRREVNDWGKWPHKDDKVKLYEFAATFSDAANVTLSDLSFALRQVVDRNVMKYCKNPSSSKLGRILAKSVFPTWAVLDPHRLSSPHKTVAAAGGGGAAAAATAIIQMFAYDAVGPGFAELREELTTRDISRVQVTAILRGSNAASKLIAFTEEEREAIISVMGNSRNGSLDTSPAIMKVSDFLTTTDLLPTRATVVSELIRISPVDVRPTMIDHYLDLRETIQEQGPKEDSDLDLLVSSGMATTAEAARSQYALADQGVRLQVVHAKNTTQLRRFEQLLRGEPPGFGYRELGTRDGGLARAKVGDHRPGIAMMSKALSGVERHAALSEPARELERLEKIEQIELSISGAFTTLLESHVMMTRTRTAIHRAVPHIARAALTYSFQSLQTLSSVVAASGGRLQQKRDLDRRHISWFGWFETAFQNRLRALIAARTALDARMLGEWNAKSDAEDLDLDQLHDVYRNVIGLPSLSAGAERNLGMQGTWLAMLDHGKLPFKEVTTDSMMSLPFLDGCPDLPPPSGFVEIDVDQSAKWHVRGGDAGNLADIVPDGLSWTALESRSGGRFSAWRNAIAFPGKTPDKLQFQR